MKKYRMILLAVCILSAIACEKNIKKTRVVGYLPAISYYENDKIEYCKLTHLNVIPLYPEADGSLTLIDDSPPGAVTLQDVKSTARAQNPDIKIYVSFGTVYARGMSEAVWFDYLASAKGRTELVSNITSYLIDNDFDGFDVDLEGTSISEGYSEFIIELKSSLVKAGKGLTAALPGSGYGTRDVTYEAMNSFDFINLMVYDEGGLWNPDNYGKYYKHHRVGNEPGQHSSYEHAASGIDYWKNARNISGDKLVLGVPFYGYDYSNAPTMTDFTYSAMVDKNPANADVDRVGQRWYNGRPTIRKKVELAAKEVSGIMIWHLGLDSFDEYSLLKTIEEQYKDLGIDISNLCN